MTEATAAFRTKFLNQVRDCERFAFLCRSSKLQQEAASRLREFMVEVRELKVLAIAESNEDLSNELLGYECALNALAHELEMYISIKSDNPGEAWSHLINAQMATKHAVQSHQSAAHLEEVYAHRLHALEHLLFPKQMFASAGFIAEEDECSICGQVYGDCNHVKGRPYMGELCSRIIKRSKLLEVSLVTDPANKHCRVQSFTDDDGTTRCPLSLEEIAPEDVG